MYKFHVYITSTACRAHVATVLIICIYVPRGLMLIKHCVNELNELKYMLRTADTYVLHLYLDKSKSRTSQN